MTHFYAALSSLPAAWSCATAELSMTFLGQPSSGGGEITAQSQTIYRDNRNALTAGLVRDARGRPAAHSTSRYFLFAPDRTNDFEPGEMSREDASNGAADAIFRLLAPSPRPIDDDMLGRLSWLDILQAQIGGHLEPPPIDRLTGIRLKGATVARILFALPAHGWLPQEIGTVFGGMIALLARSATAGAVQTISRPGTRFSALDIKVNFLRPVPADGHEILATSTVAHPGSRLTIANADVTHHGRRVAMATGTTALAPLEGNRW